MLPKIYTMYLQAFVSCHPFWAKHLVQKEKKEMGNDVGWECIISCISHLTKDGEIMVRFQKYLEGQRS